ncbi:MAG: SDR family oxidoreductase, partial [Alphaproteobacteria bacterium]|nr:SDR family oxidoreductase [Alphaproteobacteria bacterium]
QLSNNSNGTIINLIDQRVLNLTPNYSSYTVSKSGLWTLTQTMAQALAPKIRVNAIAPGFVLPVGEHDKEQFERLCAATPLRQKTQLQEICKTVNYILETPSMTGQIIAIDGGKHLGWK